ncbi:MBL fold metallo-hydrolase [Clostridium sporogenes]|uniref:MBL fold metallo-hydrolase n=1 Tax=Clostridium sporogenes TaxID=1509 RepID=UPI0013D0A9C1|nr:MBL fold metallo-hydrolase [Clostridium sporogenes]NFP91190.1 MBL fold metallo-hydrolase [Clostridium sporogenes]
MDTWFTVEQIDEVTYVISEYRHWEETHCYLLNGTNKSLLIDTGLGVENIKKIVDQLTNKPVIVIATHIHYDHIGGHGYFKDFYVHKDEVEWINGKFPLSLDYVKKLLVEEPCDFSANFNINQYEIFKGRPTKIIKDNDVIELGNRSIQVIHTPGHAPGHMCFYEKSSEYLFTGDLIYSGKLTAFFPSTDPTAYMESIKRISPLPVKKIFPGHHDLNVPISIIQEIKNSFIQLNKDGKLKHGSGIFTYNNFQIHI